MARCDECFEVIEISDLRLNICEGKVDWIKSQCTECGTMCDVSLVRELTKVKNSD